MKARQEDGTGMVKRKTNWRKTVAQERQELGWKTLTEAKQLARNKTNGQVALLYFTHRGYAKLDNCNTRKQELEWKTLTEAKQLARNKTNWISTTTVFYPQRICKAR